VTRDEQWRYDACLFITEVQNVLEDLPDYQGYTVDDLIRRATLLLSPGSDEKGKP
jgi:hypothetical protein